LLSLWFRLTTDCAEVTLANEVHQVNIVISFYFFLFLVLIGVEFIQNFAIEIVLFISVIVLVLVVNSARNLSAFKLISVHASAHLFGDFLSAARVILLTDHFECLD